MLFEQVVGGPSRNMRSRHNSNLAHSQKQVPKFPAVLLIHQDQVEVILHREFVVDVLECGGQFWEASEEEADRDGLAYRGKQTKRITVEVQSRG